MITTQGPQEHQGWKRRKVKRGRDGKHYPIMIHISRELQLHFKVSTSRLIFISLPICSELWDNYAILKNRGLNSQGIPYTAK